MPDKQYSPKVKKKCKRLEEKGRWDWQGSLRSLLRRPLHLYPLLSSTHEDWVCLRNQSHGFELLTQLLHFEHSQKTNISSSRLLFCQFPSYLWGEKKVQWHQQPPKDSTKIPTRISKNLANSLRSIIMHARKKRNHLCKKNTFWGLESGFRFDFAIDRESLTGMAQRLALDI